MEPVKRNNSSASSGSHRAAGRPPQKKKKKRSAAGVLGGTLSYILMVLGASFILSTIAILVANDMFALVKDDNTVMLEFDEDLTRNGGGPAGKRPDQVSLDLYTFC